MVLGEEYCVYKMFVYPPMLDSHKLAIELIKGEFCAPITLLRYGMHESP